MVWNQLLHLNLHIACVAGMSPKAREGLVTLTPRQNWPRWREICLQKVTFATIAIFLQGWVPALSVSFGSGDTPLSPGVRLAPSPAVSMQEKQLWG